MGLVHLTFTHTVYVAAFSNQIHESLLSIDNREINRPLGKCVLPSEKADCLRVLRQAEQPADDGRVTAGSEAKPRVDEDSNFSMFDRCRWSKNARVVAIASSPQVSCSVTGGSDLKTSAASQILVMAFDLMSRCGFQSLWLISLGKAALLAGCTAV